MGGSAGDNRFLWKMLQIQGQTGSLELFLLKTMR
jgi:hypothetical protein